MADRNPLAAEDLLRRVRDEMGRQDVKWGWPLPKRYLVDDPRLAQENRLSEDYARRPGTRKRWNVIAAEEDGEVARAGERSDERVKELIHSAAVKLSWAQAILESRDG